MSACHIGDHQQDVSASIPAQVQSRVVLYGNPASGKPNNQTKEDVPTDDACTLGAIHEN